MDDLALFPAPEPIAPKVDPKDSPGVRRTKRQAADLARGVHPLTKLPLHAEAAPHDQMAAPGRRCGDCRFRRLLSTRSRSYPKCLYGATEDYAPYAAHSEASDVRRWWPACRAHELGDPAVPDGMRWVPGEEVAYAP